MKKVLLVLFSLCSILLGAQNREAYNAQYPGRTFRWTGNSAQETANQGGISTAVVYNGGKGSFNGASSTVTLRPVGSVKSVRLKIVKLNTTTQSIITLSATHSISVSSGTVAATGFSSPTIYVNGSVSSTITTGTSDVVISTDTKLNANTFTIGKISSSYLNGDIDLVETYNRVLTEPEIRMLYRNEQWYRPPVPDLNIAYGVSWNNTSAVSTATRVGNLSKHVILPLQSKMMGCICNDNGVVVYYLNPTDWTKKTDGSASKLDGTDGQVMVEVPQFYYRCTVAGNIETWMISEVNLMGYTLSPKFYIAAYEAVQNRTAPLKLWSIVNATAEYRGGNNNAAYDAGSNSFLGKPVTSISRTNARTYVNARGTNYTLITQDQWSSIVKLYVVEYANRNCQAVVNNTLTAEGYRQGGLGNGVSTADYTEWLAFNGVYPFINCGASNSLGNGTGQTSVVVNNFGGAGVNITFTVPRYRGVENFFGHIWKRTDGINIYHQKVADGGQSLIYQKIGKPYADATAINYKLVGYLPLTSDYVKTMQRGGLIMPLTTQGSSAAYWCDYFYTPQPVANSGWYSPVLGGYALTGAYAGFGSVSSNYGASDTSPTVGARLCIVGL